MNGYANDTVERELETGHHLTYCCHWQECCPKCGMDFREMNADTRRASEAELSEVAALSQRQKVFARGCGADGCSNGAKALCSQCRNIGYCAVACQKRDWRRHKAACGCNLPTFRSFFTSKVIRTFPVGTKLNYIQEGRTGDMQVKIAKFKPRGTCHDDLPVEDAAHYSVMSCEPGSTEAWIEPCDDLHDEKVWKRVE